jgi:hydrogenase maturation protease
MVLAVGNTLCTDDGFGAHLLRHLVATDTPTAGSTTIDWIDGGTTNLVLLERLEGIDGLIVLDAAKFGESPGTVRVLEAGALDAYLGRRSLPSAHEVSLADLLDAAALTGVLPPRRALVGVEPLCLDWGTTPSEPVLAAVPRAGREVRSLIARWAA